MLMVGLAMLFLFGTIATAHCNPGISVSIVDKNRYITSPSGTAMFIVNVTSITTQAENLSLTVSGDSHLHFNWTSEMFILPTGATKLFGLGVTNPGGGSGVLNFTASAQAWPANMTYDEAVSMGLIETSSYADYAQVITPTPGIKLTKVPSATTVVSGTSVTYTYNVTNTGNVTLEAVNITDSVYGVVASGQSLTVGQSKLFTKTVVMTSTSTNTATAVGVDQYGDGVSATASTIVTVTTPPPVVGGVSASVSALSFSAPWLSIISLLAATMLLKGFVKKRGKNRTLP
jgi:hypothetical protein